MIRNFIKTRSYLVVNNFQKRSFKLTRENLQAFRGRSFRQRLENENLSMNGVSGKSTTNMLAIGSAVGVGSLALYGLASGNSSSLSAMDKAALWPDHVKSRIRQTYGYLAGSMAICATTAVQLSRSPRFLIAMGSGWTGPILMALGSIGTGIVCRSIPYPPDGSPLSLKHAMWLAYSASLGAMVAPLCLVGGPIIAQAALYTGGIVGSLSLVGVTAPSEKFLMMGGVLSMGLGVVFISSIGSIFASPISRLGLGFNAISIYGGLLVFSGFLLYDTQKVIYRAETHPNLAMIPFDPINNSIHIMLDTLNIFTRIVYILSGNNRKK